MKKIKVFQYFWGKLDSGGAETFVINAFEKMNKDEFDFYFCANENKEYFYTNKIIINGGTIVPLCEKESRLYLFRIIKRYINLYKILKKGNYDIFHCNCDISIKFIEMYIAKRAGIKVRVCHSHNSSMDRTKIKGKILYFFHKLFRNKIIKYSTCFMACSEESAKWLYGEDFDINKVIIFKNGIDVNKFKFNEKIRNQIRNNLGLNNCIVLGNVGRFTVIKNQKFILDLINLLKNEKSKYVACLIGTGEEFDTVKEYAKNLQIEDRVLFLGLTDRVNEYLMAFDYYVMPSLYEGLPVSGIEAQASGLPCLISNTVDPKVDISGNVVFLNLNDSHELWINEIKKFKPINRYDGPSLVQSAGYDINLTSKLIEKIYRKELVIDEN